MGFPDGSVGKESTCSAGDAGSIPGLGRSPGGGHGHPLQYSCLENLMNRERGGLQSRGSQRVGYDWIDWVCTHACKLSMIFKIGTTDITIMAMVNPIFWTI